MSPPARLVERVLLSALLLLLGALVYRNMDLLADSFWYIATGRYVVQGGHFPAVDPFSFAAVRTPWIVHMPGSVVLFAWLDQHFGLRSILYVATAVQTAALAVLWLSSGRSLTNRLLLAPLIAFSVYLQRDDLCARGQVFGDMLFVLLILLAARWRDGAPVRWWLAPLIGAAWINLHSSFPLGVLVPLVVAAGLLFDPPKQRPALLPLVSFAGLFALGTLLNPYGLGLVRDVLTLASHPTTVSQKLFLPPDFSRADTLGAFAMGTAALLGCIGQRQGNASRALLLVAFLCAAAAGLRYLPLLAYVSISMLGPALEPVAQRISNGFGARFRSSPAAYWAASAVGLLAAAAALWGAASGLRRPKEVYAQVPIDAARYAREHAQPNVLNDYHWGGFLLYVWQGQPKVFIDGRSYLYFNGVFEDAQRLSAVMPGSEQLLDIYELRSALLERGSPLAVALEQSGWNKVFQDRLAVVLERPVAAATGAR